MRPPLLWTEDPRREMGGTGLSAVFLGVVFRVLSFAGFEAAATLGEEAREPRRDIPRAILGVAIFGGLYFIFVTAVEVMGFGTDAKGTRAFINSGSLLGDLGSQFVAGWVGELITIGAAVSAFGCALACVVGATRLLYALSRDEVGPAPLGTVSPGTASPRAPRPPSPWATTSSSPSAGSSSVWRPSTSSSPPERYAP